MTVENEYNLYCDDEYIGTYTTSKLAERFNVSENIITRLGKTREKYKRHYELHLIHKEPTYYSKADKEWMDEWDRVTEPYRK